jgi:hypothetical protein
MLALTDCIRNIKEMVKDFGIEAPSKRSRSQLEWRGPRPPMLEACNGPGLPVN